MLMSPRCVHSLNLLCLGGLVAVAAQLAAHGAVQAAHLGFVHHAFGRLAQVVQQATGFRNLPNNLPSPQRGHLPLIPRRIADL